MTYKQIAEKLWQLLDDIDRVSHIVGEQSLDTLCRDCTKQRFLYLKKPARQAAFTADAWDIADHIIRWCNERIKDDAEETIKNLA